MLLTAVLSLAAAADPSQRALAGSSSQEFKRALTAKGTPPPSPTPAPTVFTPAPTPAVCKSDPVLGAVEAFIEGYSGSYWGTTTCTEATEKSTEYAAGLNNLICGLDILVGPDKGDMNSKVGWQQLAGGVKEVLQAAETKCTPPPPPAPRAKPWWETMLDDINDVLTLIPIVKDVEDAVEDSYYAIKDVAHMVIDTADGGGVDALDALKQAYQDCYVQQKSDNFQNNADWKLCGQTVGNVALYVQGWEKAFVATATAVKADATAVGAVAAVAEAETGSTGTRAEAAIAVGATMGALAVVLGGVALFVRSKQTPSNDHDALQIALQDDEASL